MIRALTLACLIVITGIQVSKVPNGVVDALGPYRLSTVMTFLDRTLHSIDQSAENSIVFVGRAAGHGTGFVASVSDRRALIVTNWHVASDLVTYTVQDTQGRLTKGKAIKINPSVDLAVIEVTDVEFIKNLKAVTLAKAPPKVGDALYIIGNGGYDQNCWGNVGKFQRAYSFEEIQGGSLGHLNLIEYQYDVPGIINGHSGSPVFNAAGEVVAIHNLGITGTNTGFGIPVENLKEMLRGL